MSHSIQPHYSPLSPARASLAAISCMAAIACLILLASGVRTVYPISSVNAASNSLSLRAHAGTLASATAGHYTPASLLTRAFSISPAPAPVRTGITTDDGVNMRTGPGTDYRIVAQLPVDTRTQILGDQNGWYRVLTPWSMEGWVSAGFFKADPPGAQPQPPSLGSAATVGVVNLRTGPGTGNPVVRQLSDSTVLEVLALQGAWYNVRTPLGDTGWVAAEYVPLDWIPDIYGGIVTPAAAAASASSSDAVRIAQSYLGARYVWGGSDPSGFDCSGLTWYVYQQLSVSLPAGSYQQFDSTYGKYIKSTSALAPGDLAFFERTTDEDGITHVGIYVGGGKMIAARSERLGVRYVSLADPFWSSRFVGGIRPYR